MDCPGHASLIRTIIGGAQIIDAMLLVIDITKGIQACHELSSALIVLQATQWQQLLMHVSIIRLQCTGLTRLDAHAGTDRRVPGGGRDCSGPHGRGAQQVRSGACIPG